MSLSHQNHQGSSCRNHEYSQKRKQKSAKQFWRYMIMNQCWLNWHLDQTMVLGRKSSTANFMEICLSVVTYLLFSGPGKKSVLLFSAVSSQKHANFPQEALSVTADCKALLKQLLEKSTLKECDYLVQLLFKIPQCGLNPLQPEILASSRGTGRAQIVYFVWHAKQWCTFKGDLFQHFTQSGSICLYTDRTL